jgi:hypothetical protein
VRMALAVVLILRSIKMAAVKCLMLGLITLSLGPSTISYGFEVGLRESLGADWTSYLSSLALEGLITNRFSALCQ